MTNNVKDEKEFLQMVADLEKYTAQKQGVQGDISFDMDKENMEKLNVMLGKSNGTVWSKEDVEEFMNSAVALEREQTLTEFLKE